MMFPRIRIPRIFRLLSAGLLISVLGLSACSRPPTPEPTPEATVAPIVTSNLVVAEGRIFPERSAVLSFIRGGDVAEIAVKEGTVVKEGDLILRLKQDKSLEANLTLAEKELIDAEQALEDVRKDEEVDRANALDAFVTATENLRKAQRSVYYYLVPSRVAILDMFEAVDKLQGNVDQARKDFDPYKNSLRDSSGLSVTYPTFCVPQSLCKGLTFAPDDDPFRKYKTKLDDAEGDLNIAITQMKNAASLFQAKASVDKTQADYDDVKSGPEPDKLALAEARLKTAQLKVEEAKKNLSDLEIRAPFDGTVARIVPKQGETVSAGKPAVTIADLSQWKVETDNLTEIQVVKVDMNQPVKIAADALPGVEIEGVVDNIRDAYEEKDDDVTYTVNVKILNPPPGIRWGMTVVTTFDKP